MIRRAIREGLRVKLNADWSNFYEMEKNFRLRKGLPPYYPIPEEIKGRRAILLTAYIDDELIAGHVYLMDDKHIRWWRAVSKRLEAFKKKATLIGCANKLLVWEAIKYVKDKGVGELNLGGYYVGSPNEELKRINTFKEALEVN